MSYSSSCKWNHPYEYALFGGSRLEKSLENEYSILYTYSTTHLPYLIAHSFGMRNVTSFLIR